MGNNKSATTNNAGESLAISIVIRMRQYDAGRIAGFCSELLFSILVSMLHYWYFM